MTKPPVPLLAVGAMFVLVACGSGSSAAPSSSPSPGAGFRNGASGQLVQVNGQTLILTGPNGDVTVTYTSATTFTKTSLGTLADVVRGTCIFATGQKDAGGAVTATTVLISPKTAAGCAARVGPNAGPGGTPAPGASPRPSPTARPSAAANAAFVIGEVTAVSGPSITVKTTTGSETMSVASAATITHSATVTASALQNGQCVRANGPKDSAGDVQATSITITPAGPSGTCTTGPGGGRGFPGGGGPPGGGTGG